MGQTLDSKVYTKSSMKRNLVNIFDIDGCIMPSIFPNIGEDANIPEINQNGYSVELYPNFLEYYDSTAKHTLHNIMLTGRKAHHFKQLTEYQLHPIENYTVFREPIYYEKHRNHTAEEYYSFKFYVITDLILHLHQKYENIVIRIFDDDIAYYERIVEAIAKQENPHYRIILYKIQSNEDWSNINDHIYSFIGDKEVLTYVQ